MEKRLKKATVVVAIVAGVLVLLAVVLGVLNALVGKGTWQIGWNDYRYDESGYTVGEGSIVADAITGIDIDWLDGEVEIVACDDTFASVSEHTDETLPESAKVRWRVSEDGTLSIKYRKSSWFFGFGSSNREKKLTLRIPKRFFDGINEIRVDAVSSRVTVVDLRAGRLDCETVSGEITVKNCEFAQLVAETNSGKIDMTVPVPPEVLEVSTESGDIVLRLSKDASFTLEWETDSGNLAYDLPVTKSGDRYLLGDGDNRFDVESDSGDLSLVALK